MEVDRTEEWLGWDEPHPAEIERTHTMKKRYTYEEIAQSYVLWGEYADPCGTDSYEKFNAMSVQDKVAILETCFGLDTSELENE